MVFYLLGAIGTFIGYVLFLKLAYRYDWFDFRSDHNDMSVGPLLVIGVIMSIGWSVALPIFVVFLFVYSVTKILTLVGSTLFKMLKGFILATPQPKTKKENKPDYMNMIRKKKY